MPPSPREVLIAYFDAMHALTRACMAEDAAGKAAGRYALDRKVLARLRAQHAAIAAAHFTKRRRTLVLGYGPAVLSEYATANVTLREVESAPRRVVIEVRNKVLKERRRYALASSKEGWRIGSVKLFCCTTCKRWLARTL